MRTLERRLLRLEAQSALHVSPEVAQIRASAISAIFDVLYARYPDDPWASFNLTSGRKSTSEKLREAARRVREGVPTDEDKLAIAALPAHALEVFRCTAEEMFVTVGGVLDKF